MLITIIYRVIFVTTPIILPSVYIKWPGIIPSPPARGCTEIAYTSRRSTSVSHNIISLYPENKNEQRTT